MDNVLLTKGGAEELVGELEFLRARRAKSLAAIQAARGQCCNPQEDPVLAEANEANNVELAEIARLENVLSRATIASPMGTVVAIGTTIKVKALKKGVKVPMGPFQVVHPVECNLEKGKISNACPVVKAVYGLPLGGISACSRYAVESITITA